MSLSAFALLFLTFQQTNAVEVIIVGAGAAGVAAYSKLYDSGVRDVLVLEAENRIGGRLHTVKFGDGVVEMGGEWVHGSEGNIVYELGHEFLRDSNVDSRLTTSILPEIDNRQDKILHAVFNKLFDEDGATREPSYPEETLGDYFERRYAYLTHELFKSNKTQLQLAEYALEYFHKDCTATLGSYTWFDNPAVFNYRITPGDLLMLWDKEGYKRLFDLLLVKHSQKYKSFYKQLILNTEVAAVVWKNNLLNPGAVTVFTSNHRVYHANKLILTPSIGVLKNTHKTMFRPALPMYKKVAINTMGFDGVGKLALHFPVKFWSNDFIGAGLVWTEDKDKILKEFPYGPSFNGKSWLTNLFFVYPLAYNPKVLMVYLNGVHMAKIEMLPDELIIDGVYFLFQRFFGRKWGRITKADSIIRSEWLRNPHFSGTYSYETVSSIASNMGPRALAEPLQNEEDTDVVLFAGEASHPSYYSTVHGAVESGYREADRVANITTKKVPGKIWTRRKKPSENLTT